MDTRDNVFSFSSTSPFTSIRRRPNVNGPADAIAFNGTNCSTAYIRGKFSSVNGSSAANTVAISTSSGALVTGFLHSTDRVCRPGADHDRRIESAHIN